MRARTRKHGAAVLMMALLVTAACGDDGGEESEAPKASASEVTLEISPPAGTTVKGNVVTLDLSASGVEIKAPDGDTSGKTGHFAVLVNQDPPEEGAVIPAVGIGIIHTTNTQVSVDGLAPGEHNFAVVLADGANNYIGENVATTRIIVEGPSVIANAPAKTPFEGLVQVDLSAIGVTIVGANGDTSGQTAHFHIFVDRDPVAPGELIPTGDPNVIHTAEAKAVLRSMAVGTHTAWVVLGDGVHRALNPPVRAKVAFLITKA